MDLGTCHDESGKVVAADMPFTDVEKVEAAVADGRLVLFDTKVRMVAPVIGGH